MASWEGRLPFELPLLFQLFDPGEDLAPLLVLGHVLQVEVELHARLPKEFAADFLRRRFAFDANGVCVLFD